MKKIISFLAVSSVFIVGCDSPGEANEKKTVHKVEEIEKPKEKAQKDESFLDIANELAKNSEDKDDIYITDSLDIGEEEEFKPGIYDLEVTGGSGNIFGERKDFHNPYINWVAAAPNHDNDYPSKIRMILFEGDELDFIDISKVKFHAISEEVEPSNELGIGEFIVGRDILPGDYKLSTKVKMNPEYDNLGWDITIVYVEDEKTWDQTFTPANNDVMVKLKEGEILSLSYNNTDYGTPSDDARLVFNKK